MNSYQQEQIDALTMVDRYLNGITACERRDLEVSVAPYSDFRHEVDHYLNRHFSEICTQTCYRSRLSACCSREGIITFFADVVVNQLVSPRTELDKLLKVLNKPNETFKCVYLSEEGCMWRLKPIVCQMYLCDRATEQVFSKNPRIGNEWDRLEQKRKRFTWPDRPVLFDDLEAHFLKVGCRSPLMYLHSSPGLLRVKQKAGLVEGQG